MNKHNYLISSILGCFCIMACFSCKQKPKAELTLFTKADSLTDTYLALQDSMLQTWNIMINDDNRKIEAMHNLLHELMVGSPVDQEILKSYEERIENLKTNRYTQKTMAEAQLVEEYDFASNALVTELISLAESQAQFPYNSTLQKLVDEIRLADQRVTNYREAYDLIAIRYNHFVEQNKQFMKEVDTDSFMEKKPLFQMVAEE
jgi:septal ring factor EnvC (AmiA/AmiB activator)